MAAQSIEIVRPIDKKPRLAAAMLDGLADVASAEFESVLLTADYVGGCDWLVVYGVGQLPRERWCSDQLASGGRVLLLDIGYFGERKAAHGYARCSIDRAHPLPVWIDKTKPESSRWDAIGVPLRDDYDAHGPVFLIGMGPKSWAHHGVWEAAKLADLRRRFSDREVVYRPKPRNLELQLGVTVDRGRPIEDALRGASLVVCRHSNVAVDAVIAGVPFECDDGAARWLNGKPYTRENRLDFLRRLAWWQWRADEARQMLWFVKAICD